MKECLIVGAIIDPGLDGYKLLRAIEKCQTNISQIILTHGHLNHVASIGEIIQNFGSIPIIVSEFDLPFLKANRVLNEDEMELNKIKDGDQIEVAGHKVELCRSCNP